MDGRKGPLSRPYVEWYKVIKLANTRFSIQNIKYLYVNAQHLYIYLKWSLLSQLGSPSLSAPRCIRRWLTLKKTMAMVRWRGRSEHWLQLRTPPLLTPPEQVPLRPVPGQSVWLVLLIVHNSFHEMNSKLFQS